MFVKKENEIEIWEDSLEKGIGKKMLINGAIITIFFAIIEIFAVKDIDIHELMLEMDTFIVALFSAFAWVAPGIALMVGGLIRIKWENEDDFLICKVNKDFIEIVQKKDNKKIKLGHIKQIKSYIGGDAVLKFFYEENDKKLKYSLRVSAANRGLIEKALKEYKNDISIIKKQ